MLQITITRLNLDNLPMNTIKYNLDHIIVQLENAINGIRLKTDRIDCLIPNQTIEETHVVTQKNYWIVKKHFIGRIGKLVSSVDLENVSLDIVLEYFRMYNLWRTMYKGESQRDLTFIEKDFEHPQTSSCIIYYFRKTYHNDYYDKCEVMLRMSPQQFKEYLIWKNQFDAMF